MIAGALPPTPRNAPVRKDRNLEGFGSSFVVAGTGSAISVQGRLDTQRGSCWPQQQARTCLQDSQPAGLELRTQADSRTRISAEM